MEWQLRAETTSRATCSRSEHSFSSRRRTSEYTIPLTALKTTLFWKKGRREKREDNVVKLKCMYATRKIPVHPKVRITVKHGCIDFHGCKLFLQSLNCCLYRKVKHLYSFGLRMKHKSRHWKSLCIVQRHILLGCLFLLYILFVLNILLLSLVFFTTLVIIKSSHFPQMLRNVLCYKGSMWAKVLTLPQWKVVDRPETKYRRGLLVWRCRSLWACKYFLII